MVNRWTGGFDAALELAPAGADRILAALHRKGDPLPEQPGNGPYLLHSFALNLPLAGSTSERNLRGHLQVQVSTPAVSVPAGGDGRVTVAVVLYAWFQKTFQSDPAPEFVHGTLSFTTGVQVVECSGATLAEIRVNASDVDVSFQAAPGSGLAAADAALVEELARDFLRSGLRSVQMRVQGLEAGDFRVEHVSFETLRSGSSSALAVALGFRAGATPAPGVTEVFLGTGEHAGLALGREFLSATLRDLAQGPLSGISVSGSRLGVSFQATVDATTLRIELRAGVVRAEVDGSGSLTVGSFEFRLRQDFGIAVSAGDLALTLADDPRFSVTRGNPLLRFVIALVRGRIVDKIRTAASGLLTLANAELNRIVDESVGALVAELNAPGVQLTFTRAAVDPDAVIVAGALDIGPTRPVVPTFTNQIERPPAQPILQVEVKYDALRSWIPGGTIESYRWTEVRGDGSIARTVREDHRFVLRLPQVVTTVARAWGWPPYTWCLEVRGRQFVDARDPVPVSGAVCGLSVIIPSIDLPRGAEVLAVEVPDGKGSTLADLDPWQRFRPHAFADDTEKRGVLLVHHAGERPADSLKVLHEVLAEKGPERLVFPTVIVEGEGRAHGCGAPLESLAGFALTPDREGAWRRRFNLERAGSTVIVGPGGKELWRDTGPLRADELEKVLTGLDLEGTRSPRWSPVSLSPAFGAFAPEIFLPCRPLVVVAMSKLRGRPVELVFWTSWSEASLEELERSAPASEGGAQRFAVNDGEDPALAERVLKERKIDVPLVPDPEREIARRYGVSCWPTVVTVDAAGRLAAARFGLEPDLSDAPEPEPVVY